MSSLFQGLQKRNQGSGLTIPDTFRAEPDPIDRRDRYVISPGETLKLAHRQLCRPRVRQGYIERIFLNTPINYNFDAADLQRFDESTLPRGHKRVEIDYPVTQVRDLLQYRENGLTDLEELVDLAVTDIEDVEAVVLPPVETYLWQLKLYLEDPQYAETAIKAARMDNQLKEVARQTLHRILGGVEQAWRYQTAHLDEREAEMQDRMMPGGRGQSQKSKREDHFYKNLNRTPPAGRRLELEGERDNPGNIKSFLAEIVGGKQAEEAARANEQLARAMTLIEQQSARIDALMKMQETNSKPATEALVKPAAPVAAASVAPRPAAPKAAAPTSKPAEAPKAE